jgi:hypothetical protein
MDFQINGGSQGFSICTVGKRSTVGLGYKCCGQGEVHDPRSHTYTEHIVRGSMKRNRRLPTRDWITAYRMYSSASKIQIVLLHFTLMSFVSVRRKVRIKCLDIVWSLHMRKESCRISVLWWLNFHRIVICWLDDTVAIGASLYKIRKENMPKKIASERCGPTNSPNACLLLSDIVSWRNSVK